MTDNTPAVRGDVKEVRVEGHSITRYVGPQTWPDVIRQAQTLFSSGLLPRTVRSAEAAIAIIQTGRELQLNPMEAFRNVHVIEGTPTVSPKCKLGLIQRSGLMADMRIVEGEGFAECTMRRRGMASPVTVRFTMDEAKAAGLTGKDNWRKWPRNMLRWRAIGYAADLLFSDVTGGHFSPDELGADTDEDGAPVEPPPEPVPAVDTKHMQRVQDTWRAALDAGWSESDVGKFFARFGVKKKSQITAEHLAQLEEALAPRVEGEIVGEVVASEVIDWSKDPALEGL